MQAKDDDARRCLDSQRQQVTEIEIEGQYDSRYQRPPGISSVSRLQRISFFTRQERCILKGLTNVVGFQVGIILQNLFCTHAIGNEIDHKSNGDPHPSNAGPPPMIWGSNVIRSNISIFITS